MKSKETKKQIERLSRQIDHGQVNPLEAATLINAWLNGITRAVWNSGQQQFKVFNDITVEDYRVPIVGVDRKLMEETATLCYLQAQRNGIEKPGEVHISEQISSKHHNRPGFIDYAARVWAKYSADRGIA